MVGIPLPTSFAIAGIPVAILAGRAIERATALHRPLLRLLRWTPVIVIPIAVFAATQVELSIDKGPRPIIEGAVLLLLAAAAGAIAGAPGARSPVVLAGAAIGLVVAIGTQLVPVQGTGLLGQALRFELPKTLYYWLPAILAVGAAAALAWLWQAPILPWLARVGAVGLFVVVAAVPLRVAPIDDLHLGEHRLSEALAIDLRWAGTGYWTGFPDTRNLVDPPRRALIDAVRAEIGRRPDRPRHAGPPRRQELPAVGRHAAWRLYGRHRDGRQPRRRAQHPYRRRPAPGLPPAARAAQLERLSVPALRARQGAAAGRPRGHRGRGLRADLQQHPGHALPPRRGVRLAREALPDRPAGRASPQNATELGFCSCQPPMRRELSDGSIRERALWAPTGP